MFLLREYIKSLLEARKSKESAEERLQHEIDTLKKYVDKDYFFHMTDDYKLQGVNINTDYSTPLGIYFFPLTQEFYEMIIDGTLPFAEDRKYILIYSLKGEIVRSSVYDWTDFRNDYEILTNEKLYVRQSGGIKLPEDWDIRVDHPMSALLYLVYGGEFKKKSNVIKATKNLLQLGYSGLFDDAGLGIIHENEPTQAVVFSSKYCELIDTVQNPFAIKKTRTENVINKFAKTFLTMSEDEQLNTLIQLNNESESESDNIYRLFVNIYNTNGKLSLPPRVQEFIWENFKEILYYMEDFSDNILEKLASLSKVALTNLFRNKIPDEILQYFFEHHKDKLIIIPPIYMSPEFHDIMSEYFYWDGDWNWRKKE